MSQQLKVNLLGESIDNLSSEQVIDKINSFVESGKSHHIITVNAEFLVAAQTDGKFHDILQKSHLNLADGIGVLWAAKYLSLQYTSVKFLNCLQACWQIIYSGLVAIFYPDWIKTEIVEKNSGSDIIWKIAENAERKGHSIFLLGGYGETSKIVAEKLRKKFPALNISGTYAGFPKEQGIVERINQVKPDILLVAYGPVVQERWIAENLQNLQISVAIGLGGTFDYLAEIRPLAPHFLRYRGLEWLFRLFTQPHRLFRIVNAVPVFVYYTYLYKLAKKKPYRKNIAICLLNELKKILICNRLDAYPDNHWQLPQGGVDDGLSDEQAALKELREEAGIEQVKILGKLEKVNEYDWPITAIKKYNWKYRGQSQSLIFAKTTASGLKPKPDQIETCACRWVKQSELLAYLHPIRRKLGQIAQDNLKRFFEP